MLGERVDLGKGFDDGSEHELVVTAVGERFGLWLDGKLRLTAADSAFKAGTAQVVMYAGENTPASRIKKVEYGDLDTPAPSVSTSPSPQVPGAASTFPSGKWT